MSISFVNRSAMVIWCFTAVWVGMLFIATYMLIRDGLPADFIATANILFAASFWIAAIGLALYAASKPCYLVDVHSALRISVTWRYPHKVIRRDIPRAEVQPAAVFDSKDSEGDPYHFARVLMPGDFIDIAESHTRQICEEACARFNVALFGRAVHQSSNQADVAEQLGKAHRFKRTQNVGLFLIVFAVLLLVLTGAASIFGR